jgi:hypothetical protein
VSNPQPPGHQWDPSGQTDQGTWRPGWPESQSDAQVTWSGPAPHADWEAQTQLGWDQPTPQNGWNAPEAGAHRHYQTSAHTQSYTAIRVLAQLACIALIIGGLSITENGVRGWSDVTAWAFFAATAAVVQAAPLVGSAFGVDTATSWLVGAVAAASLVLYWVLIVLPSVSTNVGFAQTMGVAAAVIGSWLSPGRQL